MVEKFEFVGEVRVVHKNGGRQGQGDELRYRREVTGRRNARSS